MNEVARVKTRGSLSSTTLLKSFCPGGLPTTRIDDDIINYGLPTQGDEARPAGHARLNAH